MREKNSNRLPWQARAANTHKGSYGHLFILGGSPGLTGAVCLAAQAAMRSGVGLVTVGIPESLNPIIEMKLTEAMSKPLPETDCFTFSQKAIKPTLDFISSRVTAVVLGPGISLQSETSEWVRELLPQLSIPMVIDADALKIIAAAKDVLKKLKAPAVLTPHPGEMSFLVETTTENVQRNRERIAEELAREYQVTVILKGHRTVITDGQQTVINLTGNPGMATAGSGDVLAGIVGSFLAQKMAVFEAARWAVYIHGLAGDLAVATKGEISLIASDLIDYLPAAFSFIAG
ncbi:MAG: NAD(P)H-hydrate dehydratase [Candidatus Omnitrophica bacterium]|nr:NAD(P)H-hydrate dehydratase [Candidatus Omnitrophota bacterium]